MFITSCLFSGKTFWTLSPLGKRQPKHITLQFQIHVYILHIRKLRHSYIFPTNHY